MEVPFAEEARLAIVSTLHYMQRQIRSSRKRGRRGIGQASALIVANARLEPHQPIGLTNAGNTCLTRIHGNASLTRISAEIHL